MVHVRIMYIRTCIYVYINVYVYIHTYLHTHACMSRGLGCVYIYTCAHRFGNETILDFVLVYIYEYIRHKAHANACNMTH